MKVTGGDLSDKRGCCLVASPGAVLRIEVASTDRRVEAARRECLLCVLCMYRVAFDWMHWCRKVML